METKFKVVTKRTIKSVKDYILFVYRARYPKTTGHFIMIGILLMGPPLILEELRDNVTLVKAMMIIGAISLLMAFFRHYIAVFRTIKDDEAYKEGWELTYQFTQKGIYAYRNGEMEKNVGSYSHVTAIYSSEQYFYIEIDEEEMYVLPVKDFAEGAPGEFEEFITKKSNIACKWYPTTFRNKFAKWKIDDKAKMQQQQKMFDEYNENQAKKKEERRKRREQRKQNNQ